VVLCSIAFFSRSVVEGRPQYLQLLPNGNPLEVSCPINATGCTASTSGSLCAAFGHALTSDGKGSECSGTPATANVDPFGSDFRAAQYNWTQTLCTDDSDGDGQYNGLELGDPCCIWFMLSTNATNLPRRITDVSHPGNPLSKTSALPCYGVTPNAVAPTVGSKKATTLRLSMNDVNGCSCEYKISVAATADLNPNDTLSFDLLWRPDGTTTVYGLTPNTQYTITAIVSNFGQDSPPSSGITATTTAPTVPEAPGIPFIANMTEDGKTFVEWTPPLEYGGLAITKYTLKLDLKEVTAGPDPFWTLDTLNSRSTYVMRVKATNDIGTGPWSDPLTFKTIVFSSASLVYPTLFAVMVMIMLTIVL